MTSNDPQRTANPGTDENDKPSPDSMPEADRANGEGPMEDDD